ncbi:hypothetical protein [Sphingomonas sp. 22176]|uniref:hypothetical protein n=1 Tax=Sphingomonas sp. 22176 TaxID=3453884 RepID=UPI003F8711BB
MDAVKQLLTLSAALGFASCAAAPSTEGRSISKEKAIKLAIEQKCGMLSRTARSRQENFASDTATVVRDRIGYAAKVSFKGNMVENWRGRSKKTAMSDGQLQDRFPPTLCHFHW